MTVHFGDPIPGETQRESRDAREYIASTDYVRYLLRDQCKGLLNMTNSQIAGVLGVSRPTLDVWLKSPWVIPVGKIDRLVSHIEFVKAAILTTESS